MNVLNTPCIQRIVAIIACLGPWTSVAAQSLPPKVLTWQAGPTGATQYIAALGEVSQPGVYAASTTPTLQQVIAAAGGLSANASLSVRIVRGERIAQSVYFNPQGHDELKSGDFVVVDARRPAGGEPGTGSEPQARGAWIGLSGVSSRPVVIPVSEPAVIMQALGQSAQLLKSTRAILPPRTDVSSDPYVPLPNGTILLVPPALLVVRTLPAFPEPISIGPREALTAQRTLPQVAMHDTPTYAPPAPEAAIPPMPAVGGSLGADLGGPSGDVTATTVPYATPRQAPIDTPANPTSLAAPGSRLALPPLPTRQAVPPQPTSLESNATAFESSPPATRQPQDGAELVGVPANESIRETEVGEPASISLWQLLGISGTVFSLVGIALGTRHFLEPTSPAFAVRGDLAAAAVAAPPAPRQRLDFPEDTPAPQPQTTIAPKAPVPLSLSLLLDRATPVTIEPADFPTAFRLQRPAATTAFWRVDDAHPIGASAPHFKPAVAASRLPVMELDEEAAPRVPRPHFRPSAMPAMAKASVPSAEAARPADVMLTPELAPAAEAPAATVASEDRSRRFDRIPESTDDTRTTLGSKSPIERALAQLQRGRSA